MYSEEIEKIQKKIDATKSLIAEKSKDIEELMDELDNLQSELSDAYEGFPMARMDYAEDR